MITRLYVNNYRCLVNFKAEFGSFAVLCGPNGAGKSSVFDALRLLRNLGTGEALLGGTGHIHVADHHGTGAGKIEASQERTDAELAGAADIDQELDHGAA